MLKLRLFVLLIVLLGVGAYFGADRLRLPGSVKQAIDAALPPMPMPETGGAEAVYKWTDAQGRVQYGTEVPKGAKAEKLSGGSVNTLNIPKPPPAPKPEQSDPLEGKTIRELAMERAIEQATK